MERIRSGWWHTLAACPDCGSGALSWPEHSDAKGKCSGCGKSFDLDNNILRWHGTDRAESTPLYKILKRRLLSLLNPIFTPLLPFRYISQIRLNRYYRRTLTDRDLAQKWADHYLGGLDLPSGAVILDFGCGRGRNIGLLNQAGYRVVGQDIKSHSWWLKMHSCGFQTMRDDSRLPWRDACFDLIVEVQVLHYVHETQLLKHIQEIKRILKPGGYWLLLEGNSKGFGARQIRKKIGLLHELDNVRKITTGNGFIEISQSFEGFYAPYFPMLVNFIRKVCTLRQFDLSDYDSWLSKKISPERRGLWLLRLKRSNT